MTDSVFPVPRTNTDPTELVVRIREDAKTHRMDFAPSKVAIDLDAAADEIDRLLVELAAVTERLSVAENAHQERWAGISAEDDHAPIWQQDSKDLSALLAAIGTKR